MGEVTITVPAEHVPDFRIAVLSEAQMDSDAVRSESEELMRKLRERDFAFLQDEDLRGTARHLERDLAVLAQVDLEGDGPREVSADTETLMAICEEMARNNVSKRLAGEADCSPVEVAPARRTMVTLEWSLSHAEELGNAYMAERVAAEPKEAS